MLGSPVTTHAQNWQTWYHEFKGDIGGHKVTGWLLNRFGSLQGGYWYDKYAAEREAMGPRNDTFTIYLEGTQAGKKIELNQTCWLCQDVPDPELFRGAINGSSITGSWRLTSNKRRFLDFTLRFENDTSPYHLPPINPNDLALYDQKDIWASGFFSSSKVQEQLKLVMGDHLEVYLDFLRRPMARYGFIREAGYLYANLWIEDMYSDRTYIILDPELDRIYVAWRGAPDGDKTRNDVEFYGSNFPERAKRLMLDNLSSSWGHVYDFTLSETRISAKRKNKSR
ncbi:MAG TPA: hypothetical protein VFH43_00140 [Candidatus Kapabacteria bacterium]|jgi:hypothetical protein|nr:hypothetical protein [Candidatus Kapabacteria bacterium]